MSLDYSGSLDALGQQIVDQITREREDFGEKYQALEKENNDLRTGSEKTENCILVYSLFSIESSHNLESIRQSYLNTVNELNQELLAMKEAYEQLDSEKQGLVNELEKRPLEVDRLQAEQTDGMVSLF